MPLNVSSLEEGQDSTLGITGDAHEEQKSRMSFIGKEECWIRKCRKQLH